MPGLTHIRGAGGDLPAVIATLRSHLLSQPPRAAGLGRGRGLAARAVPRAPRQEPAVRVEPGASICSGLLVDFSMKPG